MKKPFSRYSIPSLKLARARQSKVTEVENFEFDKAYSNIGSSKKYLVKTFGCQGNLADSEKIVGMLNKMGYSQVDKEIEADLILINTCAIRENAEDRLFGEIGRLNRFKKQKPGLIIGVCGCMMQEETTIERIEKKYPYIDLIFGTHNINKLPLYLSEVELNKRVLEVHSVEGVIYEGLPVQRDHSYKAWVNIMYGCDEFCTYCIVPYTRGKERSRQIDKIVKEVEDLVSMGYKEVTLLGQNVNAYGKDLEGVSFSELLKRLAETKIERIRYTTSHPRDLDDQTIKVMGEYPNIMPHLHLPVQSGSDKVLKKMNRKYTSSHYIDLISSLKATIKGISITTDIIVGFPSETEEDFQETLKLVHDIQFEGAFTFIFSPRPGTPAYSYENVISEKDAKDRLNRLNKLVNHYSLFGMKRFIDQTVSVLVDGVSKSNMAMLCGYTEHNKLINFESSDISLIGQIIKVRVTKANTWHLFGEIVTSN